MKNEFKHIAKLVKTNSKVLEVGCGDGELMKLISNNITSDIRGLEISKKNVQKCMDFGFNEFISKPYTRKTYVDLLDMILDNKNNKNNQKS